MAPQDLKNSLDCSFRKKTGVLWHTRFFHGKVHDLNYNKYPARESQLVDSSHRRCQNHALRVALFWLLICSYTTLFQMCTIRIFRLCIAVKLFNKKLLSL